MTPAILTTILLTHARFANGFFIEWRVRERTRRVTLRWLQSLQCSVVRRPSMSRHQSSPFVHVSGRFSHLV